MSGCMCPDDCNCHYSWRTNYCGCRAHAVVESAPRRVYVVCDTCGERFTEKQSRGHANMWGHYTFTSGGATINHSRYAHR